MFHPSNTEVGVYKMTTIGETSYCEEVKSFWLPRSRRESGTKTTYDDTTSIVSDVYANE